MKEKKICKEESCNNKSYCRGYCSLHYQKIKKVKSFEVSYEPRTGNCKADGCNKPVYSKGLCNKHWQRFHKRGEFSEESLVCDRNLSVRERLEKNKVITENGCWEWTKQRDKNGYGKMSINDYPYSVHRISYETYVGPIPEGLHVLHRCDNPSCYNPEHLWVGTNKENMKDKADKGRSCKGENSPRTNLTNQNVSDIKKAIREGLGNTEIGKMFNCGRDVVKQIKANKNWSHIE